MPCDVCEIIERETGYKVHESTPLDLLPIDSLEFLALILTIEEETGKDLPDEIVPSLKTVRDLIGELR